jgi:hypothetical protein
VTETIAAAAARWEPATLPLAADLAEARLVTHWAAQLVAAPGTTLAERRPDDSHGSLECMDGVLTGVPIAGGRRAALRPATLTLEVLGGGEVLPLPGQTLASALQWLSQALGAPLDCPDHELPAHPVGQGAPFPPVTPALAQLAAWFASAHRVLDAVAAAEPGATPVRCWPHHFDVATLIRLDPAGTRTVGVGLSPGDGSYPEPYWYVTPWPYLRPDQLPALPAGRWHTEGWVGAVLGASALAPETAGAQVAGFLRAAIPAARDALTSRSPS